MMIIYRNMKHKQQTTNSLKLNSYGEDGSHQMEVQPAERTVDLTLLLLFDTLVHLQSLST